jgi:hypothetical protein
MWATNTTPGTTDMAVALQAAVQYQYLRGGGDIRLRAESYATSVTIWVKQNVYFRGSGGGFENQYVSNEARPTGTCIFALAGTNADVVEFRCDLTNNAGTLENTTIGTRNSEARHNGGMTDLIVWGNRSLDQSYSVRDLNTSGNGLKISGSRYVEINNVTSMFAAERGLYQASYDYGLGAISPNNMQIHNLVCLSNYDKGFEVYGGDSAYSDIVCGYNGSDGMHWDTSGSLTGFLSWNNGGHGFYTSGLDIKGGSTVSTGYIYDNQGHGVNEGGAGYAPLMSGIHSRGNGMGAVNTHNFHVASGMKEWAFPGCTSNARNYLGADSVTHGFWIDNTTSAGTLEGTRSFGATNANYLVTNPNLLTENGGLAGMVKPAFTLGGAVTQSGNVVADKSGDALVVTTTPGGLFAASVDGAVWLVTIGHTGGSASAYAIVSGDAVTPLIITQASAGTPAYTFSLSGTSLQVIVASGALTSNWRALRLV